MRVALATLILLFVALAGCTSRPLGFVCDGAVAPDDAIVVRAEYDPFENSPPSSENGYVVLLVGHEEVTRNGLDREGCAVLLPPEHGTYVARAEVPIDPDCSYVDDLVTDYAGGLVEVSLLLVMACQ